MISLNEASDIIDSKIKPLPPATVPIARAIGCALAERIRSQFDVPGFSSTTMDGIALRAADLQGNGPWRLPLQKTIAAGDIEPIDLRPGYVAKIMTGAPLPSGADTVIPVEEITFESKVAVIKERYAGEDFIRPVGDDVRMGQRMYDKGATLKPVDIGVLASIGLRSVKVTPRPKIAVFSTGSELVQPGYPLKYGQIYDSNDAVLKALLTRDGHQIAARKQVIADKPREITHTLRKYLESHDLVITTGGVSLGDFDLIPDEVSKMGGELLLHKVSLKPGKPIFIAKIGKAFIVALPGNPVSVVVCYHLFARRVISRLMGKPYAPRHATAILESDIAVEGDRFCLVGAKFEEREGHLVAQPAVRQKSGRLSTIRGTDGFIFLDGGTRAVRAGSKVYVEWL